MAKAVLDKIEEKKLDKDDIAGIGVDVPGPVAADGSVPHTANLGWGYKAVTRELSELTGLPCKAGNDANVAALGEMWLGGGKGHRDVLMITLGTGVGGGIVIDGQILVGAHGAGGEIGHIHVKDGEESCCGCGNRGCLEQYASATGIARLEREWLEKSDEPSVLRDREISAKAASMTAILDPEVIVIGGGVSKAGPILLDYVRKHYQPVAYKSTRDTAFALAELGNDAGIYGCAKLMLD